MLSVKQILTRMRVYETELQNIIWDRAEQLKQQDLSLTNQQAFSQAIEELEHS